MKESPQPQKIIAIILAMFVALCLASCGSVKEVATEHALHDTLYLSTVKYDSVYIHRFHYVDRAADTIRVKEKEIEYRYRLLRDTTYIHRVDTIPQVVYVEKPQKRSSSVLQLLRALGLLSMVLLVLIVYHRIKK